MTRFPVVAAVVLASLALGPAAARDPLDLSLAIAPLDGPVAPLSADRVETDLRATFSCALLANAPPGEDARLSFEIVEHPPWSIVDVYPLVVVVPTSACDLQTQSVSALAKVFVTTLPEGPAFTPERAVARATLDGPLGRRTGEANLTIEADWVGLLEARIPQAHAATSPGSNATFPIVVENKGNAPVVVTGRLTKGAWNASGFETFALEARASRTMTVVVTVPASVVNEEALFDVEFASHLLADPSREGDAVVLAIIVSARTETLVALEKKLPDLPGATVALTLVAVALLARRVSR